MTRRNNKKLFIIIIAIPVIVGIVVFLVCKNMTKSEGEDSNGTRDTAVVEDQKKEETEKKSDDTKENNYNDNIPEKQIPKYDGEDPNKAEELSGVITYAEVMRDKFMIGVNIDQFLASGSCKLSLISDGKIIYNASAGIVADVTTSHCDGFAIPIDEIGHGEYDVLVEISSGEKNWNYKW